MRGRLLQRHHPLTTEDTTPPLPLHRVRHSNHPLRSIIATPLPHPYHALHLHLIRARLRQLRTSAHIRNKSRRLAYPQKLTISSSRVLRGDRRKYPHTLHRLWNGRAVHCHLTLAILP